MMYEHELTDTQLNQLTLGNSIDIQTEHGTRVRLKPPEHWEP